MTRLLLAIAFTIAFVSACAAESGLASYYGGRARGSAMTCAHRTRPFGTMVTVAYGARSIRCVVNDRGPFKRGRIIDVSLSAAKALGMLGAGIVHVTVQ